MKKWMNWSSSVRTAIAVAASAALGSWAHAGTDIWINPAGGQWTTAGNWSNGVPQNGDDVLDLLAGAPIFYSSSAFINSFASVSDFAIQAGILGGTFANSASGFSATQLTLNGGGISNFTIPAGVPMTIVANGGNSLEGMILQNDVSHTSGGFTEIFNRNTFAGAYTLNGGGNGIRFHDGNASVTISPTGTLHGTGSTLNNAGGGTLINNGVVSADVSGAQLTLANSNITGTGNFDARNGGTLAFAGLLNPSGATVTVDTSSTAIVDGGGLTGSVSSTTGTGISFANNGSNTISNFSLTGAGQLTFGQGAFAELSNGGNFSSGTIAMASTFNGIRFHDGNAVLTLNSGSLMHGYGATFNNAGGGTLVNNGTVSADVSGNLLVLSNSNITGTGTFDARNGGTLSIGGLLNPNGANVTVDSTSAVIINGGGLTGTVASTTGTGISFANNGSNFISNFSLAGAGQLTFGQGAFAELQDGANSVSGTIRMSSTFNGIRFHDGNAVLTLTATGQIRGYGATFNNAGGGTLVNNGVAAGDVSGTSLVLSNSNVTGSGLFTAENGGILSIAGGAVLNGNHASIVAVNGTVLIDGGSVTGSFDSLTGTGISFANNGGNQLFNSNINGNLTFGQGAFAELISVNTVGGTITMSSTFNGIRFHDGNARLTISTGGSLHGAGFTFNNSGGGTLAVDGAASGDVPGASLNLNNSNITGSGTFEGKNGGTLAIGGVLNGVGATIHSDTGTVIIDGGGITGTFANSTGSGINFANNGSNQIFNATVNGNLTFNQGAFVELISANTIQGVIAMASTSNGIRFHDGNAQLNLPAGSMLHGYGSTFNNAGGGTLNNAGTIAADVAGQTLSINNSVLNNTGTIAVSSGAAMSIGANYAQLAGALTVDGDLFTAAPIFVTAGMVGGTGLIHNSLENSGGIVSPGHSPGILTMTGNYQQDSRGELLIDLGGYAAGAGFDRLVIGGNANFAGTLDVELFGGFVPQVGDSFDVATWLGGESGTFSALATHSNIQYSVDYGSPVDQRLRITITAIPEPSMIMGLALAGAGLLAQRRINPRNIPQKPKTSS